MPIILDTNVVSELMYVSPEPNVIDWFDAQGLPFLLLNKPSLKQSCCFRIELMPEGKNRRGLMELTNSMLNVTFGRRILVFDSEAAGHYAVLARGSENPKASQSTSQIAKSLPSPNPSEPLSRLVTLKTSKTAAWKLSILGTTPHENHRHPHS